MPRIVERRTRSLRRQAEVADRRRGDDPMMGRPPPLHRPSRTPPPPSAHRQRPAEVGTGASDGCFAPTIIFLVSRVITWGTLVVCLLFTHQGCRVNSTGGTPGGSFGPRPMAGPGISPIEQGHVAGSTIAFFPLFPLSIRWLSQATGLSLIASGVVIASVTGLTAMIAVWALIRRFADQAAADRGTLLLAVFPASFVFSMGYAEGLVLTFVAFGIVALMDRRWVLAGVLGLLATGTAPMALAFEVSCLWCAYRASPVTVTGRH